MLTLFHYSVHDRNTRNANVFDASNDWKLYNGDTVISTSKVNGILTGHDDKVSICSELQHAI